MMNLFKPPIFYREVACVADDATIAAMFSSLVGEEGEYVSVLPGPRIERPDGHNEVVRRYNSVAKVRPKIVMWAGLSDEAAVAFTSTLTPSAKIKQPQTLGDTVTAISQERRRGLAGEIRCRLAEVGPGLLLAKRERKLLRVDESAPPLPRRDEPLADHVVVLDDHEGLAQVIAANYAYSIGADLVLIPQRDDSLREQVYAEFDELGAFRGSERGMRAQNCLKSLQSMLNPVLCFGQRKFVTFITRGTPYGYFYREAPSTHLFSYPNLGELINAGIYWATAEPSISAAVLIDPGHFRQSETPAVAASLVADGVCVFKLLGREANVENMELFLKAFPYDLLFICSHCGEVPGVRTTISIPDATGRVHTIEIDEAVEFGSTNFGSRPGELVRVNHLLHPVSINGVDWHAASEELKQHYKGFWDYLINTPRSKWKVLRRVDIEHVPRSTAIILNQGALFLSMQQVINASVSPIIFNNSCVSFYDAAKAFTFAGARSYVGTLTLVKTEEAQGVAERIFRDIGRAESLAMALARAQEQVFSDPEDRTYVHVGCHFNSVRPAPTNAEAIVKDRIRMAITNWRSRANSVDSKQRESISQFIRFLSAFEV